jgi:phosphoribosyl-AMP cyclohydrolase
VKPLNETLDMLNFGPHGLIPAIIQDCENGDVLMLAYMNRESLQKTLETGLTWFWSRSRSKLWQKGESSGHIQQVREIFYDCDEDTLLIKAVQTGPACHTGARSCFYRELVTAAEE